MTEPNSPHQIDSQPRPQPLKLRGEVFLASAKQEWDKTKKPVLLLDVGRLREENRQQFIDEQTHQLRADQPKIKQLNAEQLITETTQSSAVNLPVQKPLSHAEVPKVLRTPLPISSVATEDFTSVPIEQATLSSDFTEQASPVFAWPIIIWPKLSWPKLSLPKLSLPKFSLPSINWPIIIWPSFNLPTLSIPTLSIPTISLPTLSSPTLPLPTWKLPSFNWPTFSWSGHHKLATGQTTTITAKRGLNFASNFLLGGALALFLLFSTPIIILETRPLILQALDSLQNLSPSFVKPTVQVDQPTPEPSPSPEPTIASPEDVFSINIPDLDIQSVVVPNVDPTDPTHYTTALKEGIAHAQGTGLPDQLEINKTMYLFAHSTDSPWNILRYNAQFYALKDAEIGQNVELVFWGKKYVYTIEDKQIVEPQDVSALQPQMEREQLILQTCYPPGTTNKRLLIIATPSASLKAE
jgi:LPXTG-site transpeptidase (sortase) family protein